MLDLGKTIQLCAEITLLHGLRKAITLKAVMWNVQDKLIVLVVVKEAADDEPVPDVTGLQFEQELPFC